MEQGRKKEIMLNNLYNDIMVDICINNFIKHLFYICDPQDKNIYICIDGCTSLNKLNE